METNLNQFFNKLANNSSRNYKLEQLKLEKDNELLKQVIFLTLDPFTQFYIRKIPDYTPSTSSSRGLRAALKDLDALSNRDKTGNEGIEHLRSILSSLSHDDSEVIKRIIAKDLKCGVQSATVNAVWEGIVKEYPVMLASGYNKKLVDTIQFPAIAQLKMDGMRFNAIIENNKVSFKSRNGKELDLLGNLESDFLALANGKNCIFDGELSIRNKGEFENRQTGNGILAKAIKGTMSEAEAKLVHATIWDYIPYKNFIDGLYNVSYINRFTELKRLKNRMFTNRISLVESAIVKNIESVKDLFESYLAKGEEGLILKSLYAPWENKRSKHQIKFKGELECELRIVGIENGTGKYDGILGAIECESEDKIVKVSVGSGFTDAQRKEYMKENLIGKIVTVKYNTRIENVKGEQSLFLPIFIEIREDKNIANTNKEIK
ncbi:hypothetical protein M0R19_05015 [Candidatus Pacearchaeota archaeon]|nr:hypothetical protein [Candidatus Pacearchaeota archaeon]